MKNLSQKKEFLNRHTDSLPKENCKILIIKKDTDGEHTFICEWNPFDKNKYSEHDMPCEGYLGTAKVIEGRYTGIGFHAWEQNDSEFIFYKKL